MINQLNTTTRTQGMAKGAPIAAIAGDPRFGPVVTVSFGAFIHKYVCIYITYTAWGRGLWVYTHISLHQNPQHKTSHTADHRLNVFGFLALQELSEEEAGASGNYGLMDQLAALVWVQVRAVTRLVCTRMHV